MNRSSSRQDILNESIEEAMDKYESPDKEI